jgi:phage tail sheath protein FI
MSETFLHGVEVLEIDSGARPISTVRSAVIGIVGTAPDADPAAFPLNTPVLIAGSRIEAAKLDTVGDGEGTLPAALASILDQAGAVAVVVRVEQAPDNTGKLASIAVTAQGAGYSSAPTVSFSGGGGSGAAATAVLGTGGDADKVVSVTITNAGSGYTSAPTVSFSGGGGTGATATATLGNDGSAQTLANVLGGVDSNTGAYQGVHALLAAESVLGFAPRILLAPGFTHTRRAQALSAVTVTSQGTGYTSAPTVSFSGGGGTGAAATAVLGTGASAGKVVSVTVTNPGSGYTSAPTVSFSGGGGSGAAATASVGTIGNAVVAELIGIADRLRAVIIPDGPNTNDADALAYAGDFGSKRVAGPVDPKVLKVDDEGNTQTEWGSPIEAGLIAKSDAERGFWWSPSNQTINGIVGTSRPVDFALGDPSSRANLLNEGKVTTIIRQNGFRLWGNRTLSADPKWVFLSVVRTADIINDSLLRAHLWAVDRGITKTYIQDVIEGVNAYLRHLQSIGAILGGSCWADPELNTPEQIAQGKVYFDFDFTPPYPAEHITFRSHLVNDYIKEIF